MKKVPDPALLLRPGNSGVGDAVGGSRLRMWKNTSAKKVARQTNSNLVKSEASLIHISFA